MLDSWAIRFCVAALFGLIMAESAEARPAEARGPARIAFSEVSESWGIAFRHHQGGAGDFYMPESMGSGVAILDYDGDGDEDILLIDGGAMPRYEGPRPLSRLYRNDGGGVFVDRTAESGIEVRGYGMGVTAGDVDGDGDPDLYVTAWGANQLFVNRGDGSFEDVTASAGVGGDSRLWTTSAAFADTDSDGDLDLYAANYVDFSFDNNPFCGHKELGLRSYCHPDVYEGQPDLFFRNRGDCGFEDATAEAGLGGAIGKGLGVIFGDLDRDGAVDLYVANDMTANFLYRNLRDGGFEEIGLFSGVAFSDQGAPEAGMGVDLADTDGDGFDELIVTHLDMQTNALYSSSASGLFTDKRHRAALTAPSRMKVGFGVAFGDFDLDGDPDLVVANGHIIHNVDQYGTGSTYKQRNQVFRNTDGRFDEVGDSGITAVRASRGLAIGDLDGDADLDIVVNNLDDLVEVYENVGNSGSDWLAVDLGPATPPALGLGAELMGPLRQRREMRSSSSYLSQNARTLLFGAVGGDLLLRWPQGRSQRVVSPPRCKRLLVYPAGGLSRAGGC